MDIYPSRTHFSDNPHAARGVVDGGDLYNAVLKDVLGVVSVALVDILDALMVPAPAATPTKATEKPAKASTKK